MSSKQTQFVAKDIAEGSVVDEFLREGLQVTRLDIRENFLRSSTPDGKPWTPLKMPRARDGSTGPPLQDTKALYRSAIQQGATHHVEELTAAGFKIGTAHPLANVHGEGATIRPRKAKWLTIPLTREAAKAGSARNFARELFFMMKKGNNTAYLAERTPKQKKLKIHYLLKKMVVIPAREFIGIGDRLMKKLEDLYVKIVVQRHQGRGG